MTLRSIHTFLLAGSFIACARAGERAAPGASAAVAAPIVVENVGFKTPESVLLDAGADLYLVSNIDGGPLAKDDNGFVSRLAVDGSVTALRWIDGASPEVELNAPKGMGISGGVLYVADIDTVRLFDAVSGAARGSIAIAGSTFLNDIAVAADGTVYVSDSGMAASDSGFVPTGTDAVYRLDAQGSGTKVTSTADLGRPNGLAIRQGVVFVVTFGGSELYRIGAGGTREDLARLPAGSLDGLVLLEDGRAVISSWDTKTVYEQQRDGTFRVVADKLESPADIGYDAKRARVLVPLFTQDKVVLVPL